MSNVGSSSEDDDLFAAAAEVAKNKQTEGLQGEFFGPEDLPPEVKKVLGQLSSQMPPGFKIAGIMLEDGPARMGADQSHTVAADKLYHYFSRFADLVEDANLYGPALRAIYDTLDEMTGGQVTYRMRLYEVERHLVHSHRLLKSLNNIQEGAREEENLSANFLVTLDLLIRFVREQITHYTAQYRELAAERQVIPNEQIIASGSTEWAEDSFAHLATTHFLDVFLNNV